MSVADLWPDPPVIRAFLAARGWPVQVVTIDPNLQKGDKDKIQARMFSAADPAANWIIKQNARCNVYFTVNELAPSAQFNRKPKKRDILRMTWAHVDIDPLPEETPEQCKARVLGSLRAFTPRPSLVIASGGGVNALWRLSEPAEVNGHLQDLEGVNIALAKRLGGDHCHNIDRILRCPGTINHPDQKKRAKGRRPVLATLIYAGPEAYTLDQLPPPEQSAGGGVTGSELPRDLAFAGDLSDLDAAFLAKLNALLGTNPKFKATWKHTRTDLADQSPSGYDAALCSIAARAGWSDADLAALIFVHRTKQCGLEHIEKARRSDYVARTIALARAGQDDAAARPNEGPRQQAADGQDHGARAGDAPEQANGEARGGYAEDAGGDQQERDGATDNTAGSARSKQGADATAPRLSPAAPLASAREFVTRQHMEGEHRTIHHHAGTFYCWQGTHYLAADDATVRACLYKFLDTATQRIQDGETKKFSDVPFRPTRNKVHDVIDALKAAAHLDSTTTAPAWLDDTRDLQASELIACTNGLLHLPTRSLIRHTPAFFAHNALDFAYDPDALDPVEWLHFLDSLWPDDTASIETLQEMFGYLLSTDTRQQKAFLLVGPKRSGKGTIARMLTALLGRDNVCAPSLASLGANFGLQPLIGKQAAIIADARLGAHADQAAVAERLLSISGEDSITIDRKFLPAWTGRLSTRFLLLTNELPKLTDASGAIASRFIVWVLTQSFYGREDQALAEKLLCELPSILNWATEGWKRLRQRGRFKQPNSALDAVAALEDLASPIGAFLRQRCTVAPGLIVACDALFTAWKTWCAKQGRDHTGTVQTFGRDLRAALPGIRVARPRDNHDRVRKYEGLKLNDNSR